MFDLKTEIHLDRQPHGRTPADRGATLTLLMAAALTLSATLITLV